MRRAYFNCFRRQEPGLMGVGTLPGFAIGRRDMLLRTPNGNISWDCISFLDDATIAIIGAGHFCDRGVAPAFLCLDDRMESCLHATPVYVHAMDRKFATRLNSVITFWEDDELELLAGINLIRCGGHFTGSAVLHWAQGAGGRGALLTGDTITVTPDRNVSFMRSSPNLIPLDASSVYHIADALQTWQFDMIYGSAWDRVIQTDAQTVLSRSVTLCRGLDLSTAGLTRVQETRNTGQEVTIRPAAVPARCRHRRRN